MASLEEVALEIAAEQVPVLCLDTCDFLDVVRGVAEGNLFHVQSFRRMNETLELNPKQIQPLITYLVKHEWDQNQAEVSQTVKSFLEKAANSARRVVDARRLAGLPSLSIDDGLFDPALVRNLVKLAEDLMDRAVVLERDDSCVERALVRVMDRRRPSHQNEIKDSIHWEHYLELSRRLVVAGHNQHRIFVSANKADFWAKDNQNKPIPSLHADLDAEAKEAGLDFFGRMDEALHRLGV
jgi:hypothetical protein